MIPLTIKLSNFLSYRDETPVFDFTTFHVACLSGDNGAGKSSFLEAIHWAVWGEARLREPDIITRGADKMYVEYVFAVQDSIYRINRSYQRTGRGGNRLELYQATDDTRTQWTSLTAGTMRETQAKITNDIVGMSYAVFANSAYLRQGRADAFTQLTATERRDLLAEMLEIDRYNAFRDRAKAHRDRENQQIAMLQGQIAVDEQTVAQIATLTSQLDDAEAKVIGARTFVAYAQAAVARQTARQQRNEHTLKREHYLHRQAEITQEQERIAAVLADRADIEARYHELTVVEAQYAATDALRDQNDTLTAERHRLEAAVSAARATLERTIVKAQAEREQLGQAIAAADALEHELTELTSQQNNTDALTQRQAAIAAEREHLHGDIRGWERSLDRLHALEREQQNDQAALQRALDASRDHAAISADVAAAEAAASDIERLLAEHATANATLAGIAGEREHTAAHGKTLRSKIAELHVEAHCPTCHGVMDEAHVETARTTLTRELDELRATYQQHTATERELQQRLSEIDTTVATLRSTVARLPELRRRLNGLQASLLEHERLSAALTARAHEISTLQQADVPTLIATARATVGTLDAEYTQITQLIATNAAQTHRLRQITEALTTIATQRARSATLDEKLAEFTENLQADRIDPATQSRLAQVIAEQHALGYDPQQAAALRSQLQALLPYRERANALTVVATQSTALVQRAADNAEHIELTELALAQATNDYERADALCSELTPRLAGRDVSGPPAQLLTTAEHELTSRIDYASQLRVKQQNAYAAQARIETVRTQIQTRTQTMTRYQTLEQAFASKGVQAMLIREYAIPALERETNRILTQMTDNQLYLSFDTQMDTKSGGQRETLEINVSDAAGTRPLEAFSGGEAFRISFALRIALSKLLAHRAGHRLETLIIDEGFGTQDAAGRERLVEAINAISGDFKTILVITHVQEVRDLFPVQIIIRRGETGSSWEVLS